MKILFCNIAWMNEYKGITEEDEPQGGGAYVREHADAHEKYNFEAVHLTAEDCVLLPRTTGRKANLWKVPRKSKGASYGFGQSNVWFAQGREKNEYLNRFLERVIAQIEAYDGENRL